MSWFDRIKNALFGAPSTAQPAVDEDDGNEDDSASSIPERRKPTDAEVAKWTAAIKGLPDGPEKIKARLQRALVYLDRGEDELALEDFLEVVKYVPTSGLVHSKIAACRMNLDEYALAIESLDRAIALYPHGPDRALAYLNRGVSSAALDDFESALAHFNKAAEMEPQLIEVCKAERVRVKKLQKERGEKSKKTKAPPFNRLMSEAWDQDRKGSLVDALVFFGKAIDIESHQSAYYGRGVANCKMHRYVEAIADLTRALELRPNFPAALTERGLAYVEMGEFDKGIADYDVAIEQDPSYALAHDNKGAAYCMQQQWEKAIPYLDKAVKLGSRDFRVFFNRSAAHELLGHWREAARDLETAQALAPKGVELPNAAERLVDLRRKIDDAKPPEPALEEHIWNELIVVSPEDTVGDFVRRVYEEKAFFAVQKKADGRYAFASIYGRTGMRRALTEIADAIGPEILKLRLRQFEGLFITADAQSQSEPGERNRFKSGPGMVLVVRGAELCGVFVERIEYYDEYAGTTLFGPSPWFGRTKKAEHAHTCVACKKTQAYFGPKLDESELLVDYACIHCGESPTRGWVEDRMRPHRWAMTGFLGETESLRDVMAEDAQKLEALKLRPEQIANALDHLLERAFDAYKDRIAKATTRFEEELRASGKRGVEGLAQLPLGPSFDELEELVRKGKSLDNGVSIDGYEVFLQVYLGYQYCPWTIVRRPWSDDPPELEIVRHRVGNVVHLNVPTDLHLTCRREQTYRYANVEFFIVKASTRDVLRGSGILVHLIRDHGFFEGPKSPFRLDPEHAARVLGLLR